MWYSTTSFPFSNLLSRFYFFDISWRHSPMFHPSHAHLSINISDWQETKRARQRARVSSIYIYIYKTATWIRALVIPAISVGASALLVAVCSVFFTYLKKKGNPDWFLDDLRSQRDPTNGLKISKKRIGIWIEFPCYFTSFLIPKIEAATLENSETPYVKQAFLKNIPFGFEDL